MSCLSWIEDLLPIEVISEKKNNGIGYYLDDKFVLFVTEDSKTTLHKGISYPFRLYFGVFFPIVKMKHNAVIAKFSFLENHPVKKEWLYLPAENENFEDELKLVLREVLRKNPLLGIPVKETATKKRIRLARASEVLDNTDLRKPSLFNTDRPPVAVKKQPKSKPQDQSKSKKQKTSKKAENEFLLSLAKRRTQKH